MIESYKNDTWSNNDIGNQSMVVVSKPLLFQICMIEDVSRSKLSQLDDINSRLDPKNQRVDRLNASRNVPGQNAQNRNSDTHLVTAIDIDSDMPMNTSQVSPEQHVFKLTIQDKAGCMFYAVNLSPLNFLKNDGVSCMLGSKAVILPGALFNRGVFLLQETTVTFMGGMIKSWNDGRDHKLCQYIEAKLEDQIPPSSRKRKVPST